MSNIKIGDKVYNGIDILRVKNADNQEEYVEFKEGSTIENIATAAEMNAKLIETNVGKIYRFMGPTDSNYTNGDLYEVVVDGEIMFRNFKMGELVRPPYTVTVNYTADGTIGEGETIDIYDENITVQPTTIKLGTLNIGQSGTYAIKSGYLSIVKLTSEDTPNNTTGDVQYIGVSPLSDSGEQAYKYSVVGDGTINFHAWRCFVEGTNIILADGSIKKVEDITYDDELLVWDFYNAEQVMAKPIWINERQTTGIYYKVALSDGTILKLVGSNGKSHRLYNVEQNAFVYPQDFTKGEHALNKNGELLTIVSIEKVEEDVNFYNIITDKHYNLYAENILTSCRLSNRYAIKDMKYDTTEIRMTEEEAQAYIDRLQCSKKAVVG